MALAADNRFTRAGLALAAAALLTTGTTVRAEDGPRTAQAAAVSISTIGANALSDTRGAILVNQAAGDNNAQANAGAIAVGRGAVASVTVEQRVDARGRGGVARARIKAGAFSGARGWIAVNQTAGQGNAQSNAIAIAVGIEGAALGDAALARVETSSTSRTGSGGKDDTRATVGIDSTAFRGARGIIQVNQSAGRGNVTGNWFALRVDRAVRP